MAGFLISGFILTLLIAAGGAFVWMRLGGVSSATATKRRHREDARHLQSQLDADPDFTHNFHRPTQNEILETLQALDHLTPGWELDSETLTDGRLKNELAESFPALRRDHCAYPRPIASDVARLFDQAALSPEALASSLREHADRQARLRGAFHAARAQANAKHQMSVSPAVAPVALPPGSLPFRVSEERNVRRWPAWVPRVAFAALVVATVGGASWYVATHPAFRREFSLSDPAPATGGAAASPTPAATATPATVVTASLPAATPVSVEAMRAQAIAAAQASEQAEAIPPPVPATTPTPTPLVSSQAPAASQVVLAQRIAESQGRAIDKYPALGVPNSELNLRFVFRYNKLVEERSPRLQAPDWPEKLADECAAAASTAAKTKKLTQTAPGHR